ncbi:MAG: hypothetical protein M1834_002886 [Cirrosporium novae-zelandiae]|nr:MAG: hypothetical protein M1834_002886 [Cirrosporium novae-zelandiae]
MTVMNSQVSDSRVVEQKAPLAQSDDQMNIDSEINGSLVNEKSQLAPTPISPPSGATPAVDVPVNGNHESLTNGRQTTDSQLSPAQKENMTSTSPENNAPSPVQESASLDNNINATSLSTSVEASIASAINPHTSKEHKQDDSKLEKPADVKTENQREELSHNSKEAQVAGETNIVNREQPPKPELVEPSNLDTDVNMDAIDDHSTEELIKVAPDESVDATGALPYSVPPVSSGGKSETPPEPTSTSAQPSANHLQTDQEMKDAPSSPGKLTRAREDEDMEDIRAAKRSRTDENGSSVPEFKVPSLPQQSSSVASPSADRSQFTEHDLTKPISTWQHKELVRIFSSLKKLRSAVLFNKPVDTALYPNYPSFVSDPMDLGTMEQKLKSYKYKTLGEICDDMSLIVHNTTAFNGPEHIVTAAGEATKQSFENKLLRLPPADAEEPKKDTKKKKVSAAPKASAPRREQRVSTGSARSPPAVTLPAQTFALGPQGVPLIRRDSAVEGRPKRAIHPPPSRDMPYMNAKPRKKKFQLELKFCEETLKHLLQKKLEGLSFAFREPVDPVALGIPTYFSIIKNPMDLKTIGTKLETNQYENAKDFHSDVKLMFNNCYKFNGPQNPVSLQGKELEAIFDEKWRSKGQWLEQRAPQEFEPKQESSDLEEREEEEDDDEDEDEGDEMTEIQKQLLALTKKMERIQQKKHSPPVPSRKGSKSAKSGKKDTKKGSSNAIVVKKEKKPIKPKREEKTPYVTYEQKQDISNRINSLPENKMAQALEIIRSNMPKLKGVNDDEIELDIDELPNKVLFQLLQFVRRYAPQAEDSPPPPSRPAPSTHAAPSRPKKHKPMSKRQQEEQIATLQSKLKTFQHASDGSPDPEGKPTLPVLVSQVHVLTIYLADEQDAETSGDDEASDESEEE